MDIAEAIGFLQFWAFSPCRNVLADVEGPVNILFTGTGDVHHLLKSLSELCTSDREVQLNLYIHESSKEAVARALLLLYIVNEVELPIRERVELFLDVYGNALTRDRTADYISLRAQRLAQIVTGHRAAPPLAALIDLSCLKFKDRDDLEEIFRSWMFKHPAISILSKRVIK